MENPQLYKEFFAIQMEDLENNNIFEDCKAMELEISKWMEVMERSLAAEESVSKQTFRLFGDKKSINASAVDDEKENFLMPAPRGRAPRNRNRNTKSTINAKPSRPTRVTRSSKMSEIMVVEIEEDVQLNESKRTTRTRKIKKESVCSESHLLGETSVMVSEAEISATESKKGRRTTRKGTIPRASKSTRASSRASYLSRPSALGARKTRNRKTSVVTDTSNAPDRLTRSKALNDTVNTSKVVEVEEIQRTKRVTRNKASAVKSEILNLEDINNKSPAILFSPYGQSSVKQRVKAFEGLTDSNKVKEGESTNKHTSPCISSPVPKRAKAIVDSPLKKGKSNRVKDKNLTPVTENLIDSPLKEENEDEAIDNRTFQVVNENGTKETKNKVTSKDFENMTYEEALEADDEWVSDDDEKCSGVHSAKKRLLSSTPQKGKKAAEAKVATGSTKVLRGRSVQKISTEVAIASGTKTKPGEIELKEAELKKRMEKEEEARKRKEEIIKKRTETMKKKREEKMAKVKRTREELEKDQKDTKARKGRGRKKAVPVVEPEEVKKTPPPPHMITPVLNSTFNVNDNKGTPVVDVYNMTPCWQDVPPVQPENPDDYGVADKSECSSEEENDPRKKIPVWAQMKSNHEKLLSQALLPLDWVNMYWHSKPRKPTIKEFFGLQVSKRTLKRGINYRTSSACWNTPPLKKLGY